MDESIFFKVDSRGKKFNLVLREVKQQWYFTSPGDNLK